MPDPTSVIIPTLNEEKSIGRVIEEIPPQFCHQIIVIDNGSQDDTARVAAEAGVQVVVEPKRGYGHACLAGLRHVRADSRVVAFLDGDHSDYPEQLAELTGPIYEDRFDFVMGSRILRVENLAFLRGHQLWGNRLTLHLLRLFYGARFSDLGPFRAIRRESLEQLSMKDTTWGWNVEMQIKAIRAGLRIHEVPVRYRERIGHSKISGTFSGSMAAGFRILYTLLRHLQHS